MKRLLLFGCLIICLLSSCQKDEFNVFSPSRIHIGAEGGDVTVRANSPMQWCAFYMHDIAVYEHEKDENGYYVFVESIDYKKSTDALSAGESVDFEHITITFANSTTLKFTIAPCDETKALEFDIGIENKSKKGKFFEPSHITIFQNE